MSFHSSVSLFMFLISAVCAFASIVSCASREMKVHRMLRIVSLRRASSVPTKLCQISGIDVLNFKSATQGLQYSAAHSSSQHKTPASNLQGSLRPRRANLAVREGEERIFTQIQKELYPHLKF